MRQTQARHGLKRKSLIKRVLLRFIWVFAEYKYHRMVDDLGEAGELRKIPFSQKNPVCKKIIYIYIYILHCGTFVSSLSQLRENSLTKAQYDHDNNLENLLFLGTLVTRLSLIPKAPFMTL